MRTVKLKIPVWIEVITCIHDLKKADYQLRMSARLELTYSHVCRVIKELQQQKIVEIKKTGRIKMVSLTAKGKLIAEKMKLAVKDVNSYTSRGKLFK